MTIEAGRQLLHYRLVEKIGEGGMGEVWKAVDTSLDREVAIKLLPGAFARDPDRLARFEREAKLLASLNHPNLASVFGVHESEGTRFLAMELLPGEDLSQRLRRGRLPLDDALDVARQIAEALEAAHDRGVVHRDLKPANVKVAADGAVKVLDFGLAKALVEEPEPGADASLSPTVTSAGSLPGVILGTAAYMSPEQARGQVVDRRSDIWSFGCVLWECLTGATLFGGKTVSDSIGAILKSEPEWEKLPPATPPAVRRLLRRCLAKESRKRFHHIADARIELEERDTVPAARYAPTGYRIAVGLLAVALLAMVIATVVSMRQEVTPSVTLDNPLADATFSKLTDFEGSESDAAISQDGRFVAFVSDRDGPFDLWVGQVGTGVFSNRTGGLSAGGGALNQDVRGPVRAVGFSRDGSEIWLIGGTDGRVQFIPLLGGPPRNALGGMVVNPEWSRDGSRVAYHTSAPDSLYVADSNGANAQLILETESGVHQHFPTWSPDDRWIYVVRGRPGTGETDLWRVRPDGSQPERLTENRRYVTFPAPIDTQTVLFCAREEDGAGPWLWALDVESGHSRRVSIGLEQYFSIATSADGRTLVATVGNPKTVLWRVPILDRTATEDDAEPFPLPTVRALAPRFGGDTLFYLSSRGSGDGLWRYRDGEAFEIWNGSESPLLEAPAVSPDGKSVALVLRQDGKPRLHIRSEDGAELQALSEAVEVSGAGSWSPDGLWIAIGGKNADGRGLFKIPVNGGAPERISDGEALNPVWSPKGDLIVYTGEQVRAVSHLLAVRAEGEPVELPPIELLRFGERVRFLPDGSGLVYMGAKRPSQDFWLLDLATMEQRRLTRFDDTATMRTFDVTPDGSAIVFDRRRENSDIVLIELGQ